MMMMTLILVSLGVSLCFFCLIGLSTVIICGFLIRKNSDQYAKEEQKITFERLIMINYLSLSLGAFGLIIVLVGILLG